MRVAGRVASSSARADAPTFAVSASPSVAAARARARERVLLCGEGDFSFALALARAVGDRGWEITATSLSSATETRDAWRGGANLRALARERAIVEVKHDVDATALTKTFGEGDAFDRVCFNFPHAPGKGKIHKNRALLRAYVREALGVTARRGLVECALAPGQGGTAADGARAREYGNSWQAYAQGAEVGALLIEATPFDDEAWREAGYESRGHWRSLRAERGFQTSGGVVHVFADEFRARELNARCDHAPSFVRDISVWTDDARSDDAESTLRRALRRAAEDAGARVDALERVDVWLDPESARYSVTLRARIASSIAPLTSRRVNAVVARAARLLGPRRRDASDAPDAPPSTSE